MSNGLSSSLSEGFALSHNRQLSAPLFTRLASELRNIIYRLALTEYDDLSKPYDKHAHYYRPGYRFHKRIDLALLLTCKLAYLEACLVPISANEHAFWPGLVGFPDLGPPEFLRWNRAGPPAYFQIMSAEQKAAVRRIHLFTPQVWLEHHAQSNLPLLGVEPRELTITIRHIDWWFWEINEPLMIDPAQRGRMFPADVAAPLEIRTRPWGSWFARMRGLERLVLELETIEVNRAQLDEIVEQQAKDWRFELHEDAQGSRAFSNKTLKIERFKWIGTPCFKGAQYDLCARLAKSPAQVVDGTTATNGRSKAEAIRELSSFDPTGTETDGGVPYYIVRLTWDAHRAT